MTIVVDNMREGYLQSLLHIAHHGREVSPRGLLTREVLGFQLKLTDPTNAFVSGVGRKLSPAVAAAEALQLVGGFSDPAAMLKVSPHFEKFFDGGVLHAPYGPRVLPQLRRVIERLNNDESTRQAIVNIWDPVQDLLVDGSRDLPCTTHLQFMIRDGKLDLHTSMRANDAWHGYPYDVFQFTFLQCTLANVLMVEPGNYYHHATSFHLYEPQFEAAAALVYDDAVGDRHFTGVHSSDFDGVINRARNIFYGRFPNGSTMWESEQFLYDALRKRGIEGSW